MPTHARAFWLREPGCGEIRTVEVPDPGPDEVLVRTLHTALSRGTETLVFRGEVPADQYAAMRAPFLAKTLTEAFFLPLLRPAP